MPTVTLDPGGESFDCAPGDTVLRAALRAGIGMPYSCNTGSCGNCRFELREGAVRELRPDPPALTERDRARGRWLGCQSVPEGDIRVKFRPLPGYVAEPRPTRRAARFLGATPLARDLAEFRLAVEGDAAFRPGQYALFHVPGVEGARVYSMSNLPGEGEWRFVVKNCPGGAATDWLFGAARPGDVLELDGPYGTAWLREDSPHDLLLLAGGSGLSPMLSVARGAMAAGMLESRKLHFYYGCREGEDLVGAGVLGEALAARARFVPVLSEPGADWCGAAGMLHEAVRDDMGEAIAGCELYFAGPAAMSAAVQMMAHEAGMPPERMHFDEFY